MLIISFSLSLQQFPESLGLPHQDEVVMIRQKQHQ